MAILNGGRIALFFGLKTIINSIMTTTNAYSRQPSKQDYADPTKFKFSIAKLPKVEETKSLY